jgi:thiol-disulfide isomerase/thioredoxin
MNFVFQKWKINCLVALLLAILVCDIHSQSGSSIDVKMIKTSDLELIVEEAKGSALFINVWASWCAPCREEFPELVKLSEEYKSEMKFIGISADEVEDIDEKVIPFLEKQNAQFQNYLIKVSDPEDFINALNKDWSGALPATFIYNKAGTQAKMLIGKQSYEQFEQAIKKVIN